MSTTPTTQYVRYQLQAGALDIMGLRIHKLIYTEYLPVYIGEPHFHDFWQLFYFISGTGVISVNGVEDEISDGHVAIIRPFDLHSFRMQDDRTAISFEIKWQFSPALADCFYPPQWSGIFRDRYGLRLYVNQAIDELAARRRNWELMLRSIVFGMLLQIDRALLTEMQRVGEERPAQATYLYRHDVVQKAKKYLQARLHQQVSIHDVARALCVSPKHLANLFKRETGQSFAQWVIDQKLARARESLIAASEMPVGEVARRVGYNNSRYFSRLFKAKIGLTPTDYRSGHQQVAAR